MAYSLSLRSCYLLADTTNPSIGVEGRQFETLLSKCLKWESLARGAYSFSKMDIGQVIRDSNVEGEVLSKLKRVPLDDLDEVVSWLVKGMKIVLYDCHFNGRRLTKAVGGYIGRQESSNNLRLEWLRTFPEPLQIISVCSRGETFTISIDEGKYISVLEFHKVTGKYLGYVAVVST